MIWFDYDGNDDCMSRPIGEDEPDDAFLEIAASRAGALEGEAMLRLNAHELIPHTPNDVPRAA